jgi:hypothetical protein
MREAISMQSSLTILIACTASPIERKTQLASSPHWWATLERRPERTSDLMREIISETSSEVISDVVRGHHLRSRAIIGN